MTMISGGLLISIFEAFTIFSPKSKIKVSMTELSSLIVVNGEQLEGSITSKEHFQEFS